jgi:hypothetical protein
MEIYNNSLEKLALKGATITCNSSILTRQKGVDSSPPKGLDDEFEWAYR